MSWCVVLSSHEVAWRGSTVGWVLNWWYVVTLVLVGTLIKLHESGNLELSGFRCDFTWWNYATNEASRIKWRPCRCTA